MVILGYHNGALSRDIDRVLKSHFTLSFRTGGSALEPDWGNNSSVISRLDALFTQSNSPYITYVDLQCFSSPVGPQAENEHRSELYATALKKFIGNRYPFLSSSKVSSRGMGVGWERLRELIVADPLTPEYEKAIQAIDEMPARIDYATMTSRRKSLMDLGKESWDYLINHHFPKLESHLSIVIYLDIKTPEQVCQRIERALLGEPESGELAGNYDVKEQERAAELEKESQREQERLKELEREVQRLREVVMTNELEKAKEQERAKELEREKELVREKELARQKALEREAALRVERVKSPQNITVYKPVFAIKTNLLFDAATLLNVEFEVPVGRRLSFAGEWIFPWWTLDNKSVNSMRHRLQLLSASVEGRVWFGNRTVRPKLTGLFSGIYTSGGLYDFEYSKKGYQGEFFLTTGLSIGYSHSIGNNLQLEYSVGVGYLETDYRYYEAFWGVDERWHPIRKQNGTLTLFAPTKARVSLVWILNKRVK